MARQAAIGIEDFGKIIERGCFYVDKTAFIKSSLGSRLKNGNIYKFCRRL